MKYYSLNVGDEFLGDKNISEIIYLLIQKEGIEDKNGVYFITEKQVNKLHKIRFVSKKTVQKKIEYLMSIGLLDKQENSYILDINKGIKKPLDKIRLSENEVEALLNTKITNIIKVYAYLLFLNATKNPNDDYVEFNINQIRTSIGLSSAGSAFESIRHILATLESLGLISYKKYENDYILLEISMNSFSDSAIYGFNDVKEKTILIPTVDRYTKLPLVCQNLFVWIQKNSIKKHITEFIEKDKLTPKETKLSEKDLSFAIKELIKNKFLFDEGKYYLIYYGKLTDSFLTAKITEREMKKLNKIKKDRIITLYAYLKVKFKRDKIENDFIYILLPDLCARFGLYNTNQRKEEMANLIEILKDNDLIDYKLLTQKMEDGKIISRYRLYYVGLEEE